jgi:type II secretory pathway component PulJ
LKKSLGFSLFEVLICLVLLTISVLGLEAMQAKAVKDSRKFYYLCVAVHQLENMTERLYALHNLTGLESQLRSWNQENQILLPQGQGYIQGTYPNYHIMISWLDAPKCLANSLGLKACLSADINVV